MDSGIVKHLRFDALSKNCTLSSSIIELSKQQVDLSWRALMYSLPGQSFREYLQLANTIRFPIYTLDEILANHNIITSKISLKIPLGVRQISIHFFKDKTKRL
jgi:hypothetical protein